jgi:hypothetical protein
MFGFMPDPKGKQVLCQMWVNALGLTEFRPVPMVELDKNRKPAVAGYLEETEDENDTA